LSDFVERELYPILDRSAVFVRPLVTCDKWPANRVFGKRACFATLQIPVLTFQLPRPRRTFLIRCRCRRVSIMEPPLTPLPVNGTNGHHDGLLEPTPQFDHSLFRSYLSALLPPVVGALPEELNDLFEAGDFVENVSKFAAEGPDVIYVVKQRADLEGSVFCDTSFGHGVAPL
jgi:hypothetical protein